MAAPSAQDVVAVKRLMRYLSGMRDNGLVLSGTGESTLNVLGRQLGWLRRPQIDIWHAAFFGYDLVHWTSKKQGCIALSTAEAEYVAAWSCDMASWCPV
jgi:hypothetical protein